MAERKRKIESIESLKSVNKFMTSSPKKSKDSVRCGILTKSPLKRTTRGHNMFTMRLCDSDPAINTRAVCFDASKFDLLEPMKTYELRGFKLKKGFGSSELEMVIDDTTQVQLSEDQFKMERCSFNIGQIIRGETSNVRFINVKGKVVDMSDVITVGKYPDLKEKRDVVVADSSGHMTLVLWRDRAKDIDFAVDDVINIQNCVVTSFNKVFNLTTSYETTITKVAENMEVGSSVSTLKPKNTVVQEVLEIAGFKEFKSLINCANCNLETEIGDTSTLKATTAGYIVKCATCNTVFMGKPSSVLNECKFLISGSWYIGRREVVEVLFGNVKPVESPSDDQVIKLLSTKYSVRINTDLKKIEYAVPIDELEAHQELDEEIERAIMEEDTHEGAPEQQAFKNKMD